MERAHRNRRSQRVRPGHFFTHVPPTFFQPDDRSTDSNRDTAGSQAQPIRSINMNSYASQPASRQTPRLQNSQKTGLGNGNAGAGWAFGAPLSGGPFGGLGGAPGLGQSRPGQLSGFAQVMGGGSGQGPIDMSDFPSLAGSSRPQQANSGGWNSNVIRQPLQQQQQQPQQASQPPIQPQQQPRAPSAAPSHQSLDQFDGQRPQQPSGERNGGGGGEEFPPLGGQVNGEASKQTSGYGNFGILNPSQIPTEGQQSSIPLTLDELTANLEAQVQSQPQATGQGAPPGLSRGSQPAAPKSKPWSEFTSHEKFGMLGLNKMLETAQAIQTGGDIDPTLPPDIRNKVALNMGHDLNDLGLDLNSPEPLYKTFHPFPDHASMGGPFDSRTRAPIPEFHIPSAYYVDNVPAMETRMTSFNDDTLLVIFYQYPRDTKQELASMELTRREWRWHMILRQWLRQDTREANSSTSVEDHAQGIPVGATPIRLDERSEKGVYIFFNPMFWQRERREFVLVYAELENRHNQGFVGPLDAAPIAPVFGAK